MKKINKIYRLSFVNGDVVEYELWERRHNSLKVIGENKKIRPEKWYSLTHQWFDIKEDAYTDRKSVV